MIKFIHVFLLMIFLFGISFAGASITGETVTGEVITGNATSQGVSLGIYVVSTSVPSINIISPFSGTYFNNFSLPLNYTISNADSIWYNLDKGNNYTLSSSSGTYFNVSEGPHTLYLYANNSYGESRESISFTVDLTKFTILYSNLSSSSWSSTDFNSSSYEEMQSLPNIVFENLDYGKISFFDSINVTNDFNPGDSFVDLDSHVDISQNRIEINSLVLPNFNKSAQLRLYNLSFSNPRILKDGSLCSSEECQEVSYSGGTFVFNVTGFSVYSAEETPSIIPQGGGGGSSSSEESKISEEDILFKVNSLKFLLKQGRSIEKSFIVTNKGENDAKFNISVSESLADLVTVVVPEHYLEEGASEIIVVQSFSGEENLPDLYVGDLIFDFGDFKKVLNVIVQVESQNSLFDVSLSFFSDEKRFFPGENLKFAVDLRNMAGDPDLGDVDVEYIIKDSGGKIIYSSQESFAVETLASKSVSIRLPKEVVRGKYYVYVKVNYKGGTAIAYEEFFIMNFPLTNIFYISIILISLFLIFVIIFLIFRRRNRKNISRINPKKEFHMNFSLPKR